MSVIMVDGIDGPISADDLAEMVASVGKSVGRDRDDLLRTSIEDLLLQLSAYQGAFADAEQTVFEKFVKVLGFIAQVAGPAATIASAFTSVFGVVSAAKGL